MRELIRTGMLLYLYVGTVIDLRTKKIPIWYLGLGTLAAAALLTIYREPVWYEWLPAAGVAGLFFIYSAVSEESMGFGDSWMILNLGLIFGIWRLLVLLVCAFSIAAVISLERMKRKKWNRRTRIAFYPFLLLGFVGMLPI